MADAQETESRALELEATVGARRAWREPSALCTRLRLTPMVHPPDSHQASLRWRLDNSDEPGGLLSTRKGRETDGHAGGASRGAHGAVWRGQRPQQFSDGAEGAIF